MSDVSIAEAQPEAVSSASSPLSFDDFPIQEDVREGIYGLGFTQPTQVQSAMIHPVLEGRDVWVQSKTGSGKTSAFGIPLIEKLTARASLPGAPQGLVLLPTRELAHQVADELRKLAIQKGTRIVSVYGGVPTGGQVTALKMGADVVVGTPGRLLDHIRHQNLRLDEVQIAVLDEADEMLSMGFWDDVTKLLRLSAPNRQTMLLSATLPYEVAKSAAQFLNDPIRIDVSGDDLTVQGIENCIMHVLADCPKPRQMLYALEMSQPESAIIFCNTRSETDMLAKYLTQSGFVAEPLSGHFKQKERDRVMARIKNGELRYMVATDVAARGIDISDLSHVFNYALPEFSEMYLHRAGRTGRNGKRGMAISLVDGKGLGTLSQLERGFGITFKEIALPPEEEVMRARSQRVMKELAEKASMAEVGQHLPVAQDIVGDSQGPQIVAFLLKAYFNSQAELPRRPAGGHEASKLSEASARRGHGDGGSAEASGPPRRRRRRNRSSNANRSRQTHGPWDIIDAQDLLGRDAEGAGLSSGGGGLEGLGSSEEVLSKAGGDALAEGMARLHVNIGYNHGFKGRGSVAKKIAELAGLNPGIVLELEAHRDHTLLKASEEIAEMVLERVNGALLGKKVISVVELK